MRYLFYPQVGNFTLALLGSFNLVLTSVTTASQSALIIVVGRPVSSSGTTRPGVIDTLDMTYQILRIPAGTDGQYEVNCLADGCRIVAVGEKGDKLAG